jgi:hypothetical protein
MKFYTEQHPHYCGIDLHTRMMYLCILNQRGVMLIMDEVADTVANAPRKYSNLGPSIPFPGANTGTGVSSACSFVASRTWTFRLSKVILQYRVCCHSLGG